MAWKGYDFDVMNELDEKDYIHQRSHHSKSVVITDTGVELSNKLLNKYNISDCK